MTFEEWLGTQIDERNEIYAEIGQECYDNGYEQGRADATRWIPVTERLPEKDGYYYVASGYRKVENHDIRVFSNGEFLYSLLESNEYLWSAMAWMPLPEPYKEEGAE